MTTSCSSRTTSPVSRAARTRSRRARPRRPAAHSKGHEGTRVHTLSLSTQRHSQLVNITQDVRAAVAGVTGSAVLVYVPHTTAGVTINEHIDPELLTDLEDALE